MHNRQKLLKKNNKKELALTVIKKHFLKFGFSLSMSTEQNRTEQRPETNPCTFKNAVYEKIIFQISDRTNGLFKL